MALAILDGNQSATTLSSIIVSSEHIPAHTVVSLGSQAKTDILSAVSSGISISGSVTANLGLMQSVVATEGVSASSQFVKIGGHQDGSNATAHIAHVSSGGALKVDGSGSTQPVSLASLPSLVAGTAQIGSVTASISGTIPVSISSVTIGNSLTIGSIVTHGVTIANTSVTVNGTFFQATQPISISSITIGNSVTISSLPAISGTVTANVLGKDANSNATPQIPVIAYDEAIESAGSPYVVPVQLSNIDGQISSTNPLSISGTVTANPTGTQTIAGTVTSGGRWFDGTTYVPTPFMVTEDGALETTSVLVQPIPAGTAQIGSVTASLAISSTVITSGSFASLTSATLVPANTSRKMATVYNLGAGQLFVNAGATATTLGGGFMVALSSGDYFECDYTTTTLSAIFATAGTASWVSH